MLILQSMWHVSSSWTFEALQMLYCNNSKSAQKIKSDFDIVDKWIANNTYPNPLYVLGHFKKNDIIISPHIF